MGRFALFLILGESLQSFDVGIDVSYEVLEKNALYHVEEAPLFLFVLCVSCEGEMDLVKCFFCLHLEETFILLMLGVTLAGFQILRQLCTPGSTPSSLLSWG